MGCLQSIFSRATGNRSPDEPSRLISFFGGSSYGSRVRSSHHEDISSPGYYPPPPENVSDDVSLHCVEATPIRYGYLAANTGSVAILGTTAKCKTSADNIEYQPLPTEDLPIRSPSAWTDLNLKSLDSEEEPNLPTQITTVAQVEMPRRESARPRDLAIDVNQNLPRATVPKIQLQKDFEREPEPESQHEPEPMTEEKSEPIIAPAPPLVPPEVAEEELRTESHSLTDSEIDNTSVEFSSIVTEVFRDQKSEDSNSVAEVPMDVGGATNGGGATNAGGATHAGGVNPVPKPGRTRLNTRSVSAEEVTDELGRAISNTSLNTIGGEDSTSEMESDQRSGSAALRRFDTISSDGENSFNKSQDVSSYSEEFTGGTTMSFTTDDFMQNIVSAARKEVDAICAEAVKRATDIFQGQTFSTSKISTDLFEAASAQVDLICAEAMKRATDITQQQQSKSGASVTSSTTPTDNHEDITQQRPSITSTGASGSSMTSSMTSSASLKALCGSDCDSFSMDSYEQALVAQEDLDVFISDKADGSNLDGERAKGTDAKPKRPKRQVTFSSEEPKVTIQDTSPDIAKHWDAVVAAIKIQSVFRGYLIRKQNKLSAKGEKLKQQTLVGTSSKGDRQNDKKYEPVESFSS